MNLIIQRQILSMVTSLLKNVDITTSKAMEMITLSCRFVLKLNIINVIVAIVCVMNIIIIIVIDIIIIIISSSIIITIIIIIVVLICFDSYVSNISNCF